MWNFVGRQNDLEGHMKKQFNGNWVSGIPAIDENLWGSQKICLQNSKMKARFISSFTIDFRILGAFFQFNKDFGRFWAILSLFVLTSFGIIFLHWCKNL